MGESLKGKIIKGIGGFYYVDCEDLKLYECKARGVFRNKDVKPLVGDDCEIERVEDSEKLTGNIISILPRRNTLIRPAAANADQAIIIFAAAYPEPHLGLLDRFLINMEQQHVETIICFNKIDDGSPEAIAKIHEYADIYSKAGYRVLLTSAHTGEGVDKLREILKGKTSVLSGPSGVGKSSMLNALIPGFKAATGEISQKIKRGKNTTRHTELIRIDTNTYIMDTPGFSSMDFMNLTENDLMYRYREFEKYNDTCRFTGCVHMAEPGCSVKEAVEQGIISKERYESYKSLFELLKSRRKY